jgi:excinuclease ABC subunit A
VSRRRPKVNGGEVVAEGTPEQVAKQSRSFTGTYLAPLLEGGKVRGEMVGVG